jgi:type IV pilus assembly protein PilY1
MVTSGYNNADGKGYLFVLDANTGTLIKTISTGEGTATDPSGLAKITGYAEYPNDNNTVLRVYGGDLLGNLWRFDVNDTIPPAGDDAFKMITLVGPGSLSKAQPITTRPEVGKIKGYPVVFIGTGKLLGVSDLEDTSVQSIYGIKDNLDAVAFGNPRDPDTKFVEQTMTTDAFDINGEQGADGVPDLCPADDLYCPEGKPRISITKNEVDWANNNGWYADFIALPGERSNVDIDLYKKTLAFMTNIPQKGACVPAGKSNYYNLDYRTGGYVGSCEGDYCTAGYEHDDSFASSVTTVNDNEGFVNCDGSSDPDCGKLRINVDEEGDKARRVSWRELIIE